MIINEVLERLYCDGINISLRLNVNGDSSNINKNVQLISSQKERLIEYLIFKDYLPKYISTELCKGKIQLDSLDSSALTSEIINECILLTDSNNDIEKFLAILLLQLLSDHEKDNYGSLLLNNIRMLVEISKPQLIDHFKLLEKNVRNCPQKVEDF